MSTSFRTLALIFVLLVTAMAGGWRGSVSAQSPGPRALVLEPFEAQLGSGDPEVNALRAAGFQVDVVANGDVTVNEMMAMSHYSVVYMDTHSNAFSGEGVVATGQVVNATNDAALAPLLTDGSLIKVHISEPNNQQSPEAYYAITSTFVSTYLSTFPSHSFLFINGCNLLPATTFWKDLQAKGLGAMVSWDKEGYAPDEYLAAAAFFQEMLQSMTVAGAIQAEEAAGYGKSTLNGDTATLGYLGDGSITLQAAAGGALPSPTTATPTPAPTRTPTATPPPTSTPTSTPLARLPLSASLKQAVAPGTRQVITIKSSPNTSVHVRVVFPSGDSRSVNLTTDGSGTARYVYPQHASRITHQSVYATVTITAQSGQTVTTVTERYRIMWSTIDVSVQPRTQAVGRRVSIWVHTRAPHTAATITLQFPRGTVMRFQTRTGARGFARVRYTIGRYLKNGNNHTVHVWATTRLPSGLHTTETTFTIR